ncbi:FGGY-family carbohydrate kinase [Sinomonas susongensis]|uniref:FGGY-family carbohydrate kinase n=1 Tax=Sinomonas susongensis TaxID=1324851 RepID=UPI00110800FB|nr:FGGY-family carbohydrate kinase [Sinomonas susongensis]
MSSFVVAIDNGSQSTKVLVVDEHGAVHASARVGLLPYETRADGRCVHPGDDVWDSIAAACRLALGRFKGDPGSIVGVGLCTIRFCRALLDADGRLAEPMMSWMDERVGRPYKHDDEGVAWITTSSGYVSHRLTGRFRDAAGNYQGVWPIDQRTWQWSEDPKAYEDTGMPRSMLFELVAPGALLGAITPEAAAATFLPAGVPVFATSNDKAVEALGAGLSSPRELLLSLGTYVSSMTIGEAGDPGSADHWINFGSRPGQHLAESDGIRRGMWTVSWFRSLLEGDSRRDEGMYSLEASLDREAAEVPAGSDGLMTVLDWLAPAGEPHRRGAIVGFSGTQSRPHIHRSILEAIALTMADHADAMAARLGHPFETLIVSGGGARSALLVQILADVFGLPVRRADVDDAAGVGAAICAAVGAGLHPTWEEAARSMSALADPVQPSADTDAYTALRPVHRAIRSRVAALCEHLPGSAAGDRVVA